MILPIELYKYEVDKGVMDMIRKAHNVNVEDVKPVCPFDELIRHLPDVIPLGHVTNYVAQPKLMKDLHWKLTL